MGVHRTLELTSPLSNQWGQWNKSCYPHFTDEETETQKAGVKKKSSNIGNERSSFQIQHLLLLHYSTLQRHLFLLFTELHRLVIWKENWEGKEPVVKEHGGGANWEQSGPWAVVIQNLATSVVHLVQKLIMWKRPGKNSVRLSAVSSLLCALHPKRLLWHICAEICHIYSFQSLQPTLVLEMASLRLLRALIIKWCLLLIFASIYASAYKWYG